MTAVDHVGIAVPDLDVAIKWYHDHLGMIVLHEEVNEDQGIREAMLSVRGAPKGSTQVQLMAPLDETSTIAKFLDKRGPGLQQFAYRVSDLDALSEQAARRRRPAALRRAAPGHGELADQLHPPQGCRWRAGRARRAGRRRALKLAQLHLLVGPRVARFAQHGVCQCRRSSTADSPASAGHTTTCAMPGLIS